MQMPKEYPNGAMVQLAPLNKKVTWAPEYQNKILVNHKSFTRTEGSRLKNMVTR